MKKTTAQRLRSGTSSRGKQFLPGLLPVLLIIFAGCSDERTPPPTAPASSHTETLILAIDEVSNGDSVEMTFEVARELAPISQPGRDTPARLFLTAYIRPDADIEWRESIIEDSIPVWDDPIIRYQVGMDEFQTIIDVNSALLDSCDAHPGDCSDDSVASLEAGIADAEADLAVYQDSLDTAEADIARLESVADSLGLVLDDRYTISIQFDEDPMVAYPGAVFTSDELTLSGQSIFLAVTDSDGLKGRTFALDLARFNAADSNNIGRPIEINWTSCFPGSDRPCLAPGSHSFTVRVNGPETWISTTLVLVYAEEG